MGKVCGGRPWEHSLYDTVHTDTTKRLPGVVRSVDLEAGLTSKSMSGNGHWETPAIKFCPEGTARSTVRPCRGHDQSGHCLGRLAVGKAVLLAQRSPGPERRRVAQHCTKLPTPRSAN